MNIKLMSIIQEKKVLHKVDGADAAKLSSSVKHYATSYIAPTIQPAKVEVYSLKFENDYFINHFFDIFLVSIKT